MTAAPQIYQLKVRLPGISPMTLRRVLVPAATTLRDLHGILQVAMGWEGIHLFLFDVHAVRYGSLDLHAASPDVALQEFGFRENGRSSYMHDMGDHWEHEIRVEKISVPAARESHPNCTGGSGACPPEDCGGPHGCLERRGEVDADDAWRDMDIMTAFLEDVAVGAAADRQVSEFLSEDVEAALERMVVRKPFMGGRFSRCDANGRIRAGAHRKLMHQQV